MRGVVRFYNPDLQVALIERDNGLTLGSIESGHCAVNDVLLGHFRDERSGRVRNTSTGSDVRLRWKRSQSRLRKATSWSAAALLTFIAPLHWRT